MFVDIDGMTVSTEDTQQPELASPHGVTVLSLVWITMRSRHVWATKLVSVTARATGRRSGMRISIVAVIFKAKRASKFLFRLLIVLAISDL